MSKWMIGAGKQRRDGWRRVDANPRHEPDVVADCPPIPEECRGAEAFEMIHCLEHLYRWDAETLLRQFHEFLVPGGKLILELPNLQSAIDALSGKSGKPRRQWGMWVLYGDPSHRDPLYGHRWGWTPSTLRDALVAAGFENDKITDERPRYHVPDRDFRIVAVR